MQETSPEVAPANTSAASVTPTVPLQAGLPALPPTGTDPVYGAAQMYGYDRGEESTLVKTLMLVLMISSTLESV